ncbi:MAG: hypothetical protein WA885_06390 [Phormidesmis sp.]
MSSLITKVNRSYGKYFLLGIDFAFIAVNMVRDRIDFLGSKDLLAISKDGGYAEQFQYIQLAAIILLLCLLAKAKKSVLIGGWAVVFLILLADDQLRIHEVLGGRLAEWLSLQPMFNLRAKDFGELMVFSLWGVISVAILAVTGWIDRSAIAKQISKGLLLSLLGLAFFGGFFDMLHIAVQNAWSLSGIYEDLVNVTFDTVEDGGEMIVVSLALWFVYKKFRLLVR